MSSKLQEDISYFEYEVHLYTLLKNVSGKFRSLYIEAGITLAFKF
jgi:hypothetical protein